MKLDREVDITVTTTISHTDGLTQELGESLEQLFESWLKLAQEKCREPSPFGLDEAIRTRDVLKRWKEAQP